VTDRKRKPPRLRVAFVQAPALLVDVIESALSIRAGLAIVAKIAEFETARGVLPRLAPVVVILGRSDDYRRLGALLRPLLPGARVLAISADLLRLAGPGDDDIVELTLDTLAERLRG
jgi:hypothetical protein